MWKKCIFLSCFSCIFVQNCEYIDACWVFGCSLHHGYVQVHVQHVTLHSRACIFQYAGGQNANSSTISRQKQVSTRRTLTLKCWVLFWWLGFWVKHVMVVIKVGFSLNWMNLNPWCQKQICVRVSLRRIWFFIPFLYVYARACLYVCFVCACVWVLALWRGPVCVTAGPAPPGSKQYWQTHQSWWCIGLPACSPSRPQRCCGAVLTCCHLGNCCQSEWPAGIADPSWRWAGELQQEMSPAGPLRTGRPLSLSPTIDPSAAEIRHHPGRSLALTHTHRKHTYKL